MYISAMNNCYKPMKRSSILFTVNCIQFFIPSTCDRLGQSDEATMERKFTGFHQVRSTPTHLWQVLRGNNCHSYVTLGTSYH